MWPKKSMYRYCVVPECKSTTIKTPDKLFFSIPTGAQKRKDWCSAMGRTRLLRPYTNYFCCEDHFDIENDMENYMKFKLYGVSKLVLKKGILPHKFACQNYMSIKEIQEEQTASSSSHIKQEADSDSATLSCNSDTISCDSDLDNWLREIPEVQVKVELVGEPIPEPHYTEQTDPLAVDDMNEGPKGESDKTKPYIVSMIYVEKVKKHTEKK